MRWPRTPSAWERSERVLALCVAAVVSAAALAPLIGLAAIPVAAVITLALAALWRLWIGTRKATLEETLEEAELDRRLRTAIQPIGSVDPRQIGVDPATQDVLPGGEIPEYLPRTKDQEVRHALESALDGTGRWTVAVCGSSKTGKSRCLFEAIRWCGQQGRDVRLIAPKDGAAVKSLLQPEQLPTALAGNDIVVWLDDLETFVAEGVDLDALREWHERSGVIFAATYGGKGSERVGKVDDTGFRVIADTLLQHAKQVGLSRTDEAELKGLPTDISPSLRQEIKRHGLPAVMVSGPALERKLMTGRHAPGEPECQSGVAVVRAAVDWARCGRTDPIPTEKLRTLWETYLPAGSQPSDNQFQEGLEWATRPVSGTIALLRRVASYLPYDYIVSFVENQEKPEAPSDAAWAAALEGGDQGQAFSVGVRAVLYDRKEHALTAMRLASDAPDQNLARIAVFNVGGLLKEMGQTKEAEEALQAADRMGLGAAASNFGFLRQEKGDLEGAEVAFRRAAERQDPKGAFNLGVLLMEREDPASAEKWFRIALELGHEKALNNIGAALQKQGDLEQAEAAYREAIEQGDPAAANNLARLLHKDGDPEGALNAFRRADELDPGAGAYGLGRLLYEEGKVEEAEVAYRRALNYQESGSAAFGLAIVLLEMGNLEEAREYLQRTVDIGPQELAKPAEDALDQLPKSL